MTSPRGLLASFPRCHFFPSSRNKDFAKSTEDKRTHSSDSAGSSSFAHRKYQPAIFTCTHNKYYFNDVHSSIKTAELWVILSASKAKTVIQQGAAELQEFPNFRGINKRKRRKMQHCNYDGEYVKFSITSYHRTY